MLSESTELVAEFPGPTYSTNDSCSAEISTDFLLIGADSFKDWYSVSSNDFIVNLESDSFADLT